MGQSSVRTRVEMRAASDGVPGTRARVLLGDGQLDVTGCLVSALAHSLWQARGGDEMTNWADAEAALDQLLGAPAAAAYTPTRSELKPASTPPRVTPASSVTPTGSPIAPPTPVGAGGVGGGERRPTPRR